MKRTTYFVNGIVAIAAIVMFTQCTGKTGETATAGATGEIAATSGMKIAYVDIDTLLLQYNFWNDVNEEMIKREENVRATLTQKGRELEKDMQEFQRKYETNAFMNQERAQQEHNRIQKKQQDLEALQKRLSDELGKESQKNNIMLRDSINAFLKDYNKVKGYSMIISNTGFDNLLYADPSYNITKEIVEGLNARYTAPKK